MCGMVYCAKRFSNCSFPESWSDDLNLLSPFLLVLFNYDHSLSNSSYWIVRWLKYNNGKTGTLPIGLNDSTDRCIFITSLAVSVQTTTTYTESFFKNNFNFTIFTVKKGDERMSNIALYTPRFTFILHFTCGVRGVIDDQIFVV